MSVFIQLIVDGLTMGLVYVLLASGFNLIIGISRILFIAYGEFYMLGAWIIWGLMIPLKVPFFLALIIATVAPAVLGAIVYQVIFRYIQFKQQQFLTNIVAALGLTLLMAQATLFIVGTESRGIPSVIRGIVDVGGVRVSYEKVVLIGLTLAVLIGLHLLLQKTKIGRAMRAVSFNPDVAALQGVNANFVYLGTVAVGCALAGFAGGVMAPVFAVSPTMGSITLLIILVVMLGGVGSMPGAILSGLILGLVLSFGQYFLESGIAQIIFFAVIAIILFFKPGGLFGQADQIPLQ
jgi:branched-chain amino acid transport system permease protein